MAHMYSIHLVSFLFDEIAPDLKANIEAALISDKGLLAEFNELNDGLITLTQDKPLSPNNRIIENIIAETTEEALIH